VRIVQRSTGKISRTIEYLAQEDVCMCGLLEYRMGFESLTRENF
jgi:hypothetical protein